MLLHCEYDTPVFTYSIPSEVQSQASKPQIIRTKSNWSDKGIGLPGKKERIEGQMVLLLIKTVQVRFESMIMYHSIKRHSNASELTLKMVNQLMECTTLRGLMRVMNKVVMNYFNFEDINILFYDEENVNLYTLTFGDDDEHNLGFKNQLKRARDEKEREILLAKESMHDVTLKANQMINFPTHLGITAQVFKTQQTVLINDFKPSKNFNFLQEMDNPKAIKSIRNIFIGAIKKEDGTSIGVVQLFNNKNPI